MPDSQEQEMEIRNMDFSCVMNLKLPRWDCSSEPEMEQVRPLCEEPPSPKFPD